MEQSELFSPEECSPVQCRVDVSVLCFWLGLEVVLNWISKGLKTAACGCCWSWNSSELEAPEPEARVPGSVVPTLPLAFPIVCSFRNLCSQLHYNFLAKKYKTQLNFNHVNSYNFYTTIL